MDGSGDFSNQHQNFTVSSLSSPRNNGVPALHVAGLDMSRVQSDALPHSLCPSMVICETVGEADTRSTLPKMLADARSIDSCSTDDIDHTPNCPSSPQQLEELNIASDQTTALSDAVTSEEGVSSPAPHGTGRPMSAPTRSAATTGANQPSSTQKLKEKRKSLDMERQRRLTNIQESTRAALQYSAQRRTSKAETLPRDSRSASLSHSMISTASDNDISASAAPHKSSPPAVSSPLHESYFSSPRHRSTASNTSDSTVSTPLNLQRLSIDQTREASLTQMDEIWRQVEAIGDKPSERGGAATLTLADAPGSSTTHAEDDRHVGQSSDPKYFETELAESTVEPKSKRRSDILKESDVMLSFLDGPVNRSTPIRAEVGVAGGVASRDLLEPPISDNGRSWSKNRPNSFGNRGTEWEYNNWMCH